MMNDYSIEARKHQRSSRRILASLLGGRESTDGLEQKEVTRAVERGVFRKLKSACGRQCSEAWERRAILQSWERQRKGSLGEPGPLKES